STLTDDYDDKLLDPPDIGRLRITLHQRADAFLTAGNPGRGDAGSIGRHEEILPDGVEASGVSEIRKLDLARHLGGVLAWLRVADRPVGGDSNGLRLGRDCDLRLKWVSI